MRTAATAARILDAFVDVVYLCKERAQADEQSEHHDPEHEHDQT
jgi:hypothetical protein